VHDEEPEDDQGQRTAAHDYPEMGTVLTDRPDPGRQITVIGTRRQADAYGTPEDARDQDYNGGEGDLGMHWAEPGQQEWVHEHLGPQEEAPPPVYDPDMSPVMARLAQIEEAGALIGARHHATTINGTQIDGAGDAPAHGTVPRASEPNGYDDRSTEGHGDPRWNQALPSGSKKDENGATVGMYPEGMSAGGGPGLEIGAFTAALSPAELHELRRHVGGDHGFPVQDDYGDTALAAIHDGLHMSGRAGHDHEGGYEADPAWEGRDAGGYHEFTGSRRTARVPWTGKERGSLHRWQENPEGATWGDFVPSSEFPLLGPGEHVSHEDQGEGIGPVEGAGGLDDKFGPDITSLGPAMRDPSGYPLALPEHGGSADGDPERSVTDSRDFRPRPQEDIRERDPARFLRMMNALNVHVRIDGKELHEHDDPGNSLDAGKDKKPDSPQDSPQDRNDPGSESSQVDDTDSLDTPQDGPQASPQPGAQDKDADDPTADPASWPPAGAQVNETSRAYTQGSGDGQVTRGAPGEFSGAPAQDGAPPPPGSQEESLGDDPDDASGSDDESTPFSKDGALAMFTASAASPAFRFEFTAAWNDVVAKAKRIRAEGHVRIVHASAGVVVGEVRGDHDTYESGIQRPVGKQLTIQHWACGCPWASFHQDKTAGTRYAGRPCSHVMALQFEAQARGMFGRSFSSDAEVPGWSPPSVVVKSWPPYEGEPHAGRWREEWRAPLARRRAHQESASAPDTPAWRAIAALVRAGEDPEEVGALQLLAGMRATADQANSPWGSDNVTQHPPQKPYGATSPPNKDQDPGSYGPLAGPDPENWGGIQDGSVLQMPLSNTASGHQVLAPGAPHPVPGDLHWPDVNGWQAEDQGTFGYTDRASTAGPSTAMTPRDPNGIRMEESRAELHDNPEPALPSTTGDDEIEATAAADGTIGGGDAGTGTGQGAALDEAKLGEFGASASARLRQMLGGTPMGDLGRETSPQAQQPSPVGQEPGLGSMDDALSPDDPSIQTTGNQQWSGGGADSDETAVPAGQPQGGIEDIVASFQRSAAAKGYSGGSAPGPADGDIAVAARQYLTRTADALPKAEADELVREGAGSRARNLDLLRLEGTHYEDEDDDLARRGISLDDYDDDVMFA
jgi:hypothetical protein